MNLRLGVVVVALATVPSGARGLVLECRVTRKLDAKRVYAEDHLTKYRPAVRVEETTAGAKLSRCSFSPELGKETCDTYRVDRVETDSVSGHKKFYVFRSQFDVQVFSSLDFVENNGRGGVAFGTCKAISP